ncbi:MAG: hypothetical protein KGS61_12250, partial [Verrucomicrobia bacterium]|nr:hypothetical protein [Verrucomicrobiota bacterium]
MNSSHLPPTSRVPTAWDRTPLCTLIAVLALAASVHADRPQLVRPWPGGVCPYPIITATTATSTQSLTVNWTGFVGPYHLERVQDLSDTNWTEVGSVDDLSLTLPQDGAVGWFRVRGPAPGFAGAATCLQCHPDHSTWTNTAHAGAFAALKAIGMQKSASCLPCHTVGYGTPTGFTDETNTPALAGVQCENCHGPAAEHAGNPSDLASIPLKTQAGMLCGGCHTGPHNPQYDEWVTSPHAAVVPDVAASFADPTSGPARMRSCGACHSGATRLALIVGAEYDVAPLLPSVSDATNIAQTCVVCHDPHVKATNTVYQLRYPEASMRPFSYNTATTTSFAAQYDPTINVCGQCHNLRGGKWTDTSRPPHHSPQYNLLIGSGGVESTNPPPQSYHRTNETQCAQCHVTSIDLASPTAQNPN